MIASLVKNPTIHETPIGWRWCGCEGGSSQLELSFRNATLEHLYETAIDAFHEVLVWTLEQRDVCVLLLGREMRRMKLS